MRSDIVITLTGICRFTLNQEVAMELLQDMGFVVDLAEDGAVAVERAATVVADLDLDLRESA